jgi:uncharacterized protein
MSPGLEFYDVHQHVGDSSQSHGTHRPGPTVDAVGAAETEAGMRLRYMDEARIRQAVVMPGFSYDRSDGIQATRRQNDALARYRDDHSDRFVAAGIIEPRDTSASRHEIVRIADELRMVGVTLHTQYQGVFIDAQPVLDCLAVMGELNLIPLIHAPDDCLHEALWRLAKVARAFPDLTIVALEPFYLLEGQLLSDLVAEIAPNVIFDITSCWDFDHVAAFANRWGSARLLYGSHLYSNGAGTAMARRAGLIRQELETSPVLSDAAKHDIAEGNWKKLFGGRFAPLGGT